MIGAQLDMFIETPEWQPLADPHPHLQAWLGRMSDLPSFQATTWTQVAERAKAA